MQTVLETLGFTSEIGADATVPRGDWRAQANGYRVTFTYAGRTASFDCWQGRGIDHEPRADDVMGCLVSEALAGDQTFEEFCDDLGYDTDSRSAERTWRECQSIGSKLRRLFGADYLVAVEHDWELQ